MSSSPPGFSPPPGFRPPTRPVRTLWIAIATIAVVGVAAVSLFIYAALQSSPGFDGYYVDQDDYYVEGEITADITDLCDAVEVAAHEVEPFSTPAEGSKDLATLADRMRDLATAIGDESSADNLAALSEDWTTLADAVDDYADALAQGERPDIDLYDGDMWIPDRIEWSNDACYVPGIVEALAPEDINGFY